MTCAAPVGRATVSWKYVGLIKALECKKNEFVLIGLKVLLVFVGHIIDHFLGLV